MATNHYVTKALECAVREYIRDGLADDIVMYRRSKRIADEIPGDHSSSAVASVLNHLRDDDDEFELSLWGGGSPYNWEIRPGADRE